MVREIRYADVQTNRKAKTRQNSHGQECKKSLTISNEKKTNKAFFFFFFANTRLPNSCDFTSKQNQYDRLNRYCINCLLGRPHG